MRIILLGILGAALVNNAVFNQLLGLRASVESAEQRLPVGAIALATSIALVATVIGTWVVDSLLLAPGGLLVLSLLGQVLLIVFFSTLFARVCQHATTGVGSADFSLAVIANVAMLALVQLSTQRPADLTLLLAQALGTALGFSLALALFDALGDRLRTSQVPDSFRGTPIAVLSAGLVALAFLGFVGMDRP